MYLHTHVHVACDLLYQAMGLMALPQNVVGSLKNLHQLCDDIWFYAGDRSVNVRKLN